MSDMSYPTQPSENLELAAANRKLTTAILGMTLLMGLVACLSYLAGRTVTHIRTAEAAAAAPKPAVEPVVVQPLRKPSPTVVVEAAPAPEPPTVSTPAPVSTVPAPPSGTYLQVGLLDPIKDASLRDQVVAKGFSVALAPMENSPVARLLVGPVHSNAEQQTLSERLRAAGYPQHFPRRY